MKKYLIFLVITLLLVSCSSADKMTMEKFEMLEEGMTYEEVVELVGNGGELSVESGTEGTELHTVIYTWVEGDAKGSLGANASVTFQGGKLKLKAQHGLE